MSEEQNGVTRVYSCGGTGINIAAYFNELNPDPTATVIKPAFIDTSRSNLKDTMADEDIFVLEDADGSAKVRSENNKAIGEAVKQMLVKMPPGDFNIVVSSGSGGSGAIIGAHITKELLARGETVVVICIGSEESAISTNNTLKTLKTYDNFARKQGRPIPMFYEHNDERKRSEVDAQARLVISCLSVMASKANRELDSKDIAYWADFTHTTSVDAQLAQFEVFNDNEGAEEIADPFSVISIYTDPDDEPAKINPEYHAAGYLKEPNDSFERLHFVIHLEGIPSIIDHLNKKIETYTQHRDSRISGKAISSEDDDFSDDGMAL